MTVPVVRQTSEWPRKNEGRADFTAKADRLGSTLPLTIDDINSAVQWVNGKSLEVAEARQVAATAAGEAAFSADGAAESAARAAAAAENLAELDALWLGPLPADPATGKGGAPLVAGNAYINTVTGYIRAYNGTEWVQGVSAVAGVASIAGLVGPLTLEQLGGAGIRVDEKLQTATEDEMRAGTEVALREMSPAGVREAVMARAEELAGVLPQYLPAPIPAGAWVVSCEDAGLPEPEYIRAASSYLREAYPRTASRFPSAGSSVVATLDAGSNGSYAATFSADSTHLMAVVTTVTSSKVIIRKLSADGVVSSYDDFFVTPSISIQGRSLYLSDNGLEFVGLVDQSAVIYRQSEFGSSYSVLTVLVSSQAVGVTISPCGSRVAVRIFGAGIRLFERNSSGEYVEQISPFDVSIPAAMTISCMRFLEDGKHFVVTGSDQSAAGFPRYGVWRKDGSVWKKLTCNPPLINVVYNAVEVYEPRALNVSDRSVWMVFNVSGGAGGPMRLRIDEDVVSFPAGSAFYPVSPQYNHMLGSSVVGTNDSSSYSKKFQVYRESDSGALIGDIRIPSFGNNLDYPISGSPDGNFRVNLTSNTSPPSFSLIYQGNTFYVMPPAALTISAPYRDFLRTWDA